MTAITDTRKRSREDDGSCDSSMPLSKRINNLHINSKFYNLQGNGSDPVASTSSAFNQQFYEQQLHHQQDQHQNYPIIDEHTNSVSEYENNYEPELNEVENPYYYAKNKLLYELHVERIRRSNQ